MELTDEVYEADGGGWIYNVYISGESIFEAFWPAVYEREDVLGRGRSFFAKQLREALAGRR